VQSDLTVIPATPDAQVLDRATAVQEQLRSLKGEINNNFFELCDLLSEAHAGAYHTLYGFSQFGDWIEQGSGLDLSARQGFYYVQIAKKARQLGLTREDLLKSGISKLKKIFSLDPLEFGDEIKQLLAAGETESLSVIEAKVQALRKQAGKPSYKTLHIRIEADVEPIVDEAFELARRNYGSIVQDGEIDDVSDGKCLELISAEYIQDPNNHEEREFGGGAIDVEYEEVEE
jgi:hypothetical protein